MESMGEPLCERTAHETDYGPVIQIDGELVLDNPALDHLQARKQARARKSRRAGDADPEVCYTLE